MEKVICIERREKVSDKPYYNLEGNWIPRVIIWPEYNGCYKDTLEELEKTELDDYTEEEWGRIISSAFKIFLKKHRLQYSAFTRQFPTFFQKK